MCWERGFGTVDRRILVAGFVAWVACATCQWWWGGPLGDNEALYARSAELVLRGDEPPWTYLSRGTTLIAAPGVLLGGGERALRLLPMLLGLGFVTSCALVARRLAGATVAAWLVAVMASTNALSIHAAALLSDLPAAALLLAGLAVAVVELDRDDGPSRRVIAVAPLLAAAVYVRYGSVLPIAIIAACTAVYGHRGVARRPARIAATLAVFVVLLIPLAIHSLRVTGSPIGILLDSQRVLRVRYRCEGLVGFVAKNPVRYYGKIAAPLLVLGLASIIRPRDRRAVLVWAIAVADIVVLGLTTVAESRYIAMPLVLLLVLGVDVVVRWLATRSWRARRALAALALAGLVAAWLPMVHTSVVRGGRHAASWEPVLEGAAAIRRDAGGSRCVVVTRHPSQVEWYSGCPARLELPDVASDRKYLVVDDLDGTPLPTARVPADARTLLERPGVVVTRLAP